eukprot:gene4855-11072_t
MSDEISGGKVSGLIGRALTLAERLRRVPPSEWGGESSKLPHHPCPAWLRAMRETARKVADDALIATDENDVPVKKRDAMKIYSWLRTWMAKHPHPLDAESDGEEDLSSDGEAAVLQ